MLAVWGAFVLGGVFSFALPVMAEPGNPIKGISVKGGHNPSGITASDLGITDVGTLPTSGFYFFKEWRRVVHRLFTFNTVAGAELELNIANEKAAEIIEVEKAKPDDSKATEKAIKNYNKAQDRLKAQLGKLTENSENPNVAKLLEKVDEKTVKHLLLLGQISEKVAQNDGYADLMGEPDLSSLKLALKFKLTNCSDKAVTPSKDDDCDGVALAIENAQAIIHATVVVAAEKDTNIKQTAADEIACAKAAIEQYSAGKVKCWGYSALGVNGTSETSGNSGSQASENCGLCLDFLKRAQQAFAEEKYGEAFALARRSQIAFGWVYWTDAKTAPAPKGDVVDKSVTPTIQTPKSRSIPENSVEPTASDSTSGAGTPTSRTTEPMFCTAQYDPVCGEGGRTYGNSCEAGLAKVVVKYAGECRSTDQPSSIHPDTGTTNPDGARTQY